MSEQIDDQTAVVITVITIIVIILVTVSVTSFSKRKHSRPKLQSRHSQESRRLDDCLMVRYVRISTDVAPLVLGQVEVFVGKTNVAPINGNPRQSSVRENNVARYGPRLAINGELSATGFGSGDASQTQCHDTNPWWELDLGSEMPLNQINLWPEDRGKFPHPSSSWFLDHDMLIFVELFCAKRSLKWYKHVHCWKDVVVLPIGCTR